MLSATKLWNVGGNDIRGKTREDVIIIKMETLPKKVHLRSIYRIRKTLFLLSFSMMPFLLIEAQKMCPQKCLCHLDQNPRIITCSGHHLSEFPQNLSNLVSPFTKKKNKNIMQSDII